MLSHNNTTPTPLAYGCTEWRKSSQCAANAYKNGARLWTKENLRDIEEQLRDSMNRDVFSVLSIEGSKVLIQNPSFGEDSPIWKPFVKFQDYWLLVKEQPQGPPETFLCSYLVHWSNQTARDFRGVVHDSDSVFAKTQAIWNQSLSFDLLQKQLREILADKKVTKLICFGLGDMCRHPPEWLTRQSAQSASGSSPPFGQGSMVQHSIALTIAEFCRNGGASEVQLLAQDPDYTEQTEELLRGRGFSIVGRFGAEGFAEIDDETVVFSAFVEAPLKQIIAEIARPPLIISTGPDAFNNSEKPWADAESPRTRDMWRSYRRLEYPIAPADSKFLGKLGGLYLYDRIEIVR